MQVSFCVSHSSWSTTPCLNTARHSHRVIWIPDGRLFAIGGAQETVSLNSVEMIICPWNSAKKALAEWRIVAPMQSVRNKFGAALIRGWIIVAGGNQLPGVQCIDIVEMFTPPSIDNPQDMGQWTFLNKLPQKMLVSSAVVFQDDVYVFGESFDKDFQKYFLVLSSISETTIGKYYFLNYLSMVLSLGVCVCVCGLRIRG